MWTAAYEIPYEKLYERGYRGIIFDVDNTLVPHGGTGGTSGRSSSLSGSAPSVFLPASFPIIRNRGYRPLRTRLEVPIFLRAGNRREKATSGLWSR